MNSMMNTIRINKPNLASNGAQPSFDLYRVSDRKRFQALLSCGAGLVIVIDMEGKLRYLSPAVKGLLTHQSNSVIGQHVLSFVHRRDLYHVMRSLERLLSQHKQYVSWILRLLTQHGHWQWFKATATRFSYDDDQEIVAIQLQDLADV